jgi:glycogen operon protein
VKDILWLNPTGHEMTDEEWGQADTRCLGMFVSGDGLDERDERNRPIKDDNLLMLTNAHHETVPFQLPGPGDMAWLPVLDTAQKDGVPAKTRFRPYQTYPLEGRSLALLVQVSKVPG